MMSSNEVIEVIKSSVKVNVAKIDKVIIMCSGRISMKHIQAIRQFMVWLSYDKFPQKFVFIYNKSDGLSEAEKLENIAYMVNALQGDPCSNIQYYEHETGEYKEVKMNLPIGFPKGASYSDVSRDHIKLINATLVSHPKQRIPVDKSLCTIL